MELLRYNNLLVNVVYSDCVISYIANSFYKVSSAKYGSSFGTKDKVNMKNTNVQNVYNEKEKRNRKKEKQFIYTDNCVLLVGCSQEQTSLLYKTVMKLKSEEISTFIICNEADATNIQSNIFLYNIIVLNLENFQDDYDFSILLGHVIFIAVDDIYEIYKKKKQNTLKGMLKFCREKQEHGEFLQILLTYKWHDEWISNDMIHFLRSLKYDVLSEQVSVSQAVAQGGSTCRSDGVGDGAFDRGVVNRGVADCGTLGENGGSCPPFHCFNLRGYKKSDCRHMSIDAPLNEDKKFLILFYLLKTNKGKKVLIYYSKSDIYTFYTLLNSYIPCVFISSSYKMSCKSNIVNVFNKRDDYILITDDKYVQKLHQVNADLYIHYTFHECVNSYVDMLSSGVTASGEASPGEVASPGMSVRSKYMRDREHFQSRSKHQSKGIICQSILFYNRRVKKQYEKLDRLLGFTTYVLPPIREMKNMFLDFIMEEIKNVVIEDSKHMEEASRICKKTTFVHKGQYKSKKSRRRLKKRMNMKREQMEMSRLRNRMISTFKMGARNGKM
ncbi:conserved Plasmodium protein, unknown function [Plasmodium ovale wallikeri]|uniref:Uncharacterized protein n=1 Tax=Plasmodium ovale wallikeri TaxID=864142 RepID=A0A1A8YUY8_PLAOA|nr:conserved Plasmodium protein, unknown function [Plasmodium ovale wallikeri]SBT35442.1 conserved Plasmodium protein, unknown function [Plasmodium ovale wallikeri]